MFNHLMMGRGLGSTGSSIADALTAAGGAGNKNDAAWTQFYNSLAPSLHCTDSPNYDPKYFPDLTMSPSTYVVRRCGPSVFQSPPPPPPPANALVAPTPTPSNPLPDLPAAPLVMTLPPAPPPVPSAQPPIPVPPPPYSGPPPYSVPDPIVQTFSTPTTDTPQATTAAASDSAPAASSGMSPIVLIGAAVALFLVLGKKK
jgi:hypothetical protein